MVDKSAVWVLNKLTLVRYEVVSMAMDGPKYSWTLARKCKCQLGREGPEGCTNHCDNDVEVVVKQTKFVKRPNFIVNLWNKLGFGY